MENTFATFDNRIERALFQQICFEQMQPLAGSIQRTEVFSFLRISYHQYRIEHSQLAINSIKSSYSRNSNAADEPTNLLHLEF